VSFGDGPSIRGGSTNCDAAGIDWVSISWVIIVFESRGDSPPSAASLERQPLLCESL
jgi:hypothetical protein